MESLIRFGIAPEQVKLHSGRVVLVPRCFVHFKPWIGNPIRNTYGRKAVINFSGEALFAELAILRLLQNDGWDGVWVDSFRRKFRRGLPERTEPCDLPMGPKDLFERIVVAKGSRGGCWDVFAWKEKEFLFAEAKRTKKDLMRPSQYQWLEAGLTAEVPLSSFLLVEWELEQSKNPI